MVYDYSKLVKDATVSLSKDDKRKLLIRAGVIDEKTNKVEKRYENYYRIKDK